MSHVAEAPCEACLQAQRAAAVDGNARCSGCGAYWEDITSPVTDRTVRQFVHEVLSWDASVARVESAAHRGASNILGVLDALQYEFVGTGNRGTKGVGKAPRHEHETRPADPELSARYKAIGRTHQTVVDAIVADGQGDQRIKIDVAGERVMLSLSQRIGYRLASRAQRSAWERKVLSRDSAPALAGMEHAGDALLLAAATAWQEAKNVSAATG